MRSSALVILLSTTTGVGLVPVRGTARPFTVLDDIALAHFGDPYTAKVEPFTWSPDARYVVVVTERGRIDLNRPESSLYVYARRDIREYTSNATASERPPSAVWKFSRATYRNGPIISDVRWLGDSSAFAFLEKNDSGTESLFLADIARKTLRQLTPKTQSVRAYDIADRQHFVYAVSTLADEERSRQRGGSVVGTGRSLPSLIHSPRAYPDLLGDQAELWAGIDGKRRPIVDESTRRIFHLYGEGESALSMAPTGRSVATILPIEVVPTEWEAAYPPPYSTAAVRIHAALQDLRATDGRRYVGRYAIIDLVHGRSTPVIDAPTAGDAGWFSSAGGRVSWSRDSQAIILPSAYVRREGNVGDHHGSRPCVAVVNLSTRHVTCLSYLDAQSHDGYPPGFRFITHAAFAAGSNNQIALSYESSPDWHAALTFYTQSATGVWEGAPAMDEARSSGDALDISIEQSPTAPPVLVATNARSGISRTMLDPNEWLNGVDLGEVETFKWKDDGGLDVYEKFGVYAGLFKPPGFVQGHRYPLVIQTHGFSLSEFRPSGVFPTAFAARELAASGIVVLQVNGCAPVSGSAQEARCNVNVLEAAVKQLVRDEVIDPTRVGIVGFSRTCWHVIELMVAQSLQLRAASITDGINLGYLEYVSALDEANNAFAREADSIIGTRPFGEGLQQWVKMSPVFNMDKVTTPLQVVALGPLNLLSMWEPYAALRYLNRPVDLIMTSEEGSHVLSNPAQRLVSQQGTVDWFRFWLQGYEDSAAERVEQYQRWERLCDMQVAQNPNQPSFCVRTKTH